MNKNIIKLLIDTGLLTKTNPNGIQLQNYLKLTKTKNTDLKLTKTKRKINNFVHFQAKNVLWEKRQQQQQIIQSKSLISS